MEIQNQNPQPNLIPEQPKSNWFLKHEILYIIIIVLFFVVIVGSVYWWKAIKETPQITHQEQAQINEIATWKTQTNTKYGFEYNYPSNYISEDNFNTDDDSKFLDVTTGNSLWVTYSRNDKTLKQFGDSYIGETIRPIVYKDTTINNKKGIQTSRTLEDKGSYYYTFIDLGNAVVAIDVFAIKQSDAEKLNNQIISSFKFVESNKATGVSF